MNQQLHLVPETVLKKKHDLDELRAHRAAQSITNGSRANRKVFNSKTKAIKIRKPESIIAKARSQRNHARRYQRVLKKGMQKRASNTKVEKVKVVVPEGMDVRGEEEAKKEVNYVANSIGAKIVFVVRIREPNGMPKNVKRVLDSLRLKSVNEGVFCAYNQDIKKRLHLIEPWVTYGIPSQSMISDLIRRRGHGKIDGKRVPLSNNTIVENALSEKTSGAVICVDDMVHEIHSVGTEFRKVNAFMWTFQLTSPKSKFQKQKLNYKDGGDYGDRGEEMDDLIRQML